MVLALLGASGFALAAAASAPIDDGRVVVSFVHPEQFTDAKDHYVESDQGRDAILGELRDHLMDRARRYIPSGERLEVYFTDVDLAGEYEPWRGARWDDVRIVKDIYPPRVDLHFKLYAADGRVLQEGERKLSDLAFMYTISINVDDPLRYDKELLDNWVRQEFPRDKRS